MFKLLFLGTARIDADTGRVAGEAAQRHRLALLALLSAARGATLPRETLTALLWPEQGEKEARHLLNVAVHVMRKTFGEDALHSEGAEIRLNTSLLPSDVVSFREARQRGDLRQAMDLYGGEFLSGFYLDDAEEFERWQETERARLKSEFEEVLEARADAAEREGDIRDAVQVWRRLLELKNGSARVTMRLMRALEAVGDRVGALAAAEFHVTALARDFGAEPSPDVVAFAEKLRMHPASVGLLTADLTASAKLEAGRGWGRRIAVAAALVVAAGAAFAASDGFLRNDEASVAVLPFVDLSATQNQAYLGDGITEELLNALARIKGLRVAARSSSFQFRDKGVDIRAVGKALNVGAVVEGSVRLEGDRLRVTAQLIDARGGFHIWSQQYDRRFGDVFSLQEDIAREVASALSAELVTGIPDILVARATKNPLAYDFYLRGRHQWNRRTREGMLNAVKDFQQAISLDPAYAAAYAGLADAWQLLPDYADIPAREGLAHAKTNALRAIALDSNLAAAHASLAALLDDYDRDRAGAERAYRKAIALNPGYSTARQWLAIHLADDGRFDEALAEIERARRLDPLSRIINTAVGAVRYFAKDHAGSVAEYRAVLDAAPDFALAWALMGRTLLIWGRVDAGVDALAKSVELSRGDPSYRAVYAAALAAAGRTPEAKRIATELLSVPDDAYVPFTELASAYLYLGDNETALSLFERAFEDKDPAVKHMKVEPLYDRIRGHPRFERLLERAGLRDSTPR